MIFREREKHRFVVPLIYASIGWFLYVTWLGIQPPILAYQNNTHTDWTFSLNAHQFENHLPGEWDTVCSSWLLSSGLLWETVPPPRVYYLYTLGTQAFTTAIRCQEEVRCVVIFYDLTAAVKERSAFLGLLEDLAKWPSFTVLESVEHSSTFGLFFSCKSYFIFFNPHPRICFYGFHLFILIFYLFISRERGRVGGKHRCERNTNWLAATRAHALTGNQNSSLLLCRTLPNQLSQMGQSCFYWFERERERSEAFSTCSDQGLNLQSLWCTGPCSWATWATQPGHKNYFLKNNLFYLFTYIMYVCMYLSSQICGQKEKSDLAFPAKGSTEGSPLSCLLWWYP